MHSMCDKVFQIDLFSRKKFSFQPKKASNAENWYYLSFLGYQYVVEISSNLEFCEYKY